MAYLDQGLVYIILVGAGLAVGLRVLGRTLYPDGVCGDVFYHLLCAQAIRENSLRLPKDIPGFIWQTGYTYPPLYHLLLALFPERYGKFFERYSSLIFDLVQTVFVWYTTRAFFSYLGDVPALAEIKALAVSGANIVSPMLNAYISGPRSMTGTGRTLGEGLFVVAVCSTLLWEMGRGHGFALVAIFCYGFVPLASKFGLQSLVALFLVLGLALKFKWCLLMIAGMGVGFLVSRGHLLKVIKGQLYHSLFYFQFLQPRRTGLEGLHGVRAYCSRLIEVLKPPGIGRKLTRWLLEERCATHVVVVHNFHIWILAFLWLGNSIRFGDIGAEQVLKSLFFLSIVPFFPLILTTLKPFRFLGENYRYLEYYQWAYWLLLCYFSPGLFSMAAIIAAIFTCCLLVIQLRYVRDWEQAYNNSAPFFDHVKRVYAGKKAYVLSGTYYELCYRGNVDILYWSSNMMPGIVPYGELDELFHRWPFPREGNGYQRVLKRYGVELVMCHEATAEFLGPSTLVGLEAIEMPPSQYRLFRLN
ncbi:MAG: hypothetical protein PVF10_11600 [Syntrophobacterales bacterium]|jgi:hypothetical protein